MKSDGSIKRWATTMTALGGLLIGLAMVFHPLFSSDQARVLGGWRDPRLVHFQLEHAYGCLVGARPHRSLWDAPIFYPAENTTALSDTLVGFVPFYAPWRLLGLAPGSAMGLWLATMLGLGFVAFFAFLRSIGSGPVAAAAGAFLFAFGSPVIANIGHPQLVPGVYVAVALLAARRLFDPQTRRRGLWVAALVGALTLQAWGAFYTFFFTVLFLAIAAVLALTVPSLRQPFVGTLRRDAGRLAVGAVVGGLLLMPLAMHYAKAAESSGGRDWAEVSRFAPSWQSWTLMGASSWLYDVSSRRVGDGGRIKRHPSHTVQGMGFVTLAAAIIGLWIGRRRPGVLLIVGVALVVVLLVMPMPGGFVLWQIVHRTVPVADAVRAIGRILRWTLIPAAIGLAILIDRLVQVPRQKSRIALAGMLVGIVFLEQAHTVGTTTVKENHRRVGRIATRVPPDAEAFFVSSASCNRFWHGLDEDAMWAASVSGVPTINGRSGATPPGWGLGFAYRVENIADRSTIRRRVFDWIVSKGVDPREVVWLDLACNGRVVQLSLLEDEVTAEGSADSAAATEIGAQSLDSPAVGAKVAPADT